MSRMVWCCFVARAAKEETVSRNACCVTRAAAVERGLCAVGGSSSRQLAHPARGRGRGAGHGAREDQAASWESSHWQNLLRPQKTKNTSSCIGTCSAVLFVFYISGLQEKLRTTRIARVLVFQTWRTLQRAKIEQTKQKPFFVAPFILEPRLQVLRDLSGQWPSASFNDSQGCAAVNTYVDARLREGVGAGNFSRSHFATWGAAPGESECWSRVVS